MSLRCRDLSDRRTLKADHQGSIVAVSTGLGVQPYAYDDYGIPNPGQSGRFQYTGQAWIAPLSMYYYKARIYSPTLGRFLQTDPIGYDDQVNLYAYVGNDPVNRRDPTGKETCVGSSESCGKVRRYVALFDKGARTTTSPDTQRLRDVNSLIGPPDKGAPVIIDEAITTAGHFDTVDKSLHINPSLIANDLIGAGVIGHEGDHQKTEMDKGPMKSLSDRRSSEVSAFTTENQFRATQGAFQVDPAKMAEKSIAVACAGSNHQTCQ